MVVFRSRGTMPVVRDVLMMFMTVGKRMSSFHKEAWWEWDQVHKTWQMTIFKTNSSVTGSKLSKGFPAKEV